MKILDILCALLFNASPDVFSILWNCLTFVGLWGIFQKCGVKGWWALVPFAREYKLGLCAGRESEGRVLAVVDVLMNVCNAIVLFLNPESSLYLFLGTVAFILLVIQFIYMVRVELGLIEVFGRKKKWIILWAVLDNIVAPLWGFHKKFQPLWTVEEIQSEASNFFSGSKARCWIRA